ncbi:MAG: hypothetical protein NXI01_00485 [Gammaproteobacteria bacterium]|nr:hypothetical protein [Gammaproteobacteria bacterium]
MFDEPYVLVLQCLRLGIWFFCVGCCFSNIAQAAQTHLQHIIINNTPFEFYYTVVPSAEVPTIFSCNCSGIIVPNEEQACDCWSDLEPESRRYRIDYMKNISPTYSLSATTNATSGVTVIWTFDFDRYWEWLSVTARQQALKDNKTSDHESVSKDEDYKTIPST